MKPSPFISTLAPAAQGWNVWRQPGEPQFAPSFGEAAALVPAGSEVHLVLPTNVLVVERLRLPSTDPDELASMVQLQWEKSLPYSVDELASDFIVLEIGAHESTVLALAAPHDALEIYRETLRARALRPVLVSPYLAHVARACPAGRNFLEVHVEAGHRVISWIVDRQAAWVQVLPEGDEETSLAGLPQLLLTASLEGVIFENAAIRLAPEAAALAPAFEGVSTSAAEIQRGPTAPFPPTPDLLPAPWKAELHEKLRARRWRRHLALAAAVWLAAIGAGLWHLAALRTQSGKLDAELAGLRPRLSLQQARQARSTALGAAIDPRRYPLEILQVLLDQMRSDGLRLTEFDQTPDQWHIVGEAPSAGLATEYVSRLKQHSGLSAWQITSTPPQLLANDRAQFSIFAKP